MESAPIREVPIDRWGRALLEEILFRAAQAATETDQAQGTVEVAITFRLTPDVVSDCLEIRTDGIAEAPLVTRLPRPF